MRLHHVPLALDDFDVLYMGGSDLASSFPGPPRPPLGAVFFARFSMLYGHIDLRTFRILYF
jgi:hypothetical protein